MVIIHTRQRRFFGSAAMGDSQQRVGLAIDSTPRKTMVDGIYGSAVNLHFFANLPSIVHRLDDTAAFLPWPPLNEISMNAQSPPPAKTSQSPPAIHLPRCPCCRENTTQMLCVVCALQQLRMTRIRESYRAALRRKAETCQRLGQRLKEQCNNQRDTHAKDASVDALRAKIASKRASIERLHHRLRNININSVVTRKNNTSLEEKIAKHAKLYAQLDDALMTRRVAVGELERVVSTCHGAVVGELAAVFAVEPLDRPATCRPPAQQGGSTDAWRNALQNTNTKRPAYFSVRGLTINDQGDLEALYSEEHCRILDHSKLRSRSLLNTLANNIISSPEIRGCNVKPCRQTLGALLFVARQLEILALLLDFRLPYADLCRSWEELCEFFHKGSPVTRTKSGIVALRSLIFRLDWAIVALGASCGALNARNVEFNSPMYNLLSILQAITGGSPSSSSSSSQLQPKHSKQQETVVARRQHFLRPTPDAFSEQLHYKIIKNFSNVHGEESGEFSVDNVEEDWVNIGLTLK